MKWKSGCKHLKWKYMKNLGKFGVYSTQKPVFLKFGISVPPLSARLPRPLRPFHYCHIRQRHNCFSELQECLKKLDNTFSIPKSKTDWWAKNGRENSLHSKFRTTPFLKTSKKFDDLKIQKLLILWILIIMKEVFFFQI